MRFALPWSCSPSLAVVALCGVAAAGALVACGPPPPGPPPSAQVLLQRRTSPEPVTVRGALAEGTTVSAGPATLTLTRAVEDVPPRDLTRESLALALDVASRVPVRGVARGADAVAKALALADAFGKLVGTTEQKTAFEGTATVEGRVYAASCATTVTVRGLDERQRPTLSCVITPVPAGAGEGPTAPAPDHVWELEAKTVGGRTEGLSHPVTLVRAPAGESFWMQRPEHRSLVMGGKDYSAFIVGKDGGGGPSVGRLGVGGQQAAWIDPTGLAPESVDVLRVAFAAMSLVPWPFVDLR